MNYHFREFSNVKSKTVTNTLFYNFQGQIQDFTRSNKNQQSLNFKLMPPSRMEMFDLNNSHTGLSSVETLYSQQQRIFLKSKKGEEKSRSLRVTVEIKSGLTISVGKVLSLQITDDNDCMFFYSLLLTHEDFSVLKCQQGLLVDFEHFPSQLVKLLETCKSQEFNKFILVLDEEDMTQNLICEKPQRGFVFLKVIETNNFKNLCHLSLKVLQGSDSDIKNHMSVKINNLTEKLLDEEKKYQMIEMKFTEALKALDAKTKELTEFQLRLAEEKNGLKLEMSQQLSEEREKFSRFQLEWQQKLELERSMLGKQYQKQISDMNEQINSLTFNNKNLYETKCQFETAVKEKMFHIEALEKQNNQLQQEVNLLRKQNSQLDQEYHEKDKTVVGLRTKLAVVEQELKDKGKYLDKQQELLKVANEQKAFLEEALNERDAQLQRKTAAVQTLTADLMKSNEIITKLQTDLAANKAKMKLRTDIALEQEKILEKKTQEMASQAQTIKEFQEETAKLKEELASLKDQLEELNRKLEEKDISIKKNENVINWLNRRLTESSSMITSNRSGSESAFGPSQSKGAISSLAKGWPPWLVNSIAGNNSSQDITTGLSNSTNGTTRLSTGSTPVEILQNKGQRADQKPDQNKSAENKEQKEEPKIETKSRGLDPKYFESCTEKDFILNPQLSKTSGSAKSSELNVKLNSGRQPHSAYFPKKSVPL